jgi:hypothetical protein
LQEPLRLLVEQHIWLIVLVVMAERHSHMLAEVHQLELQHFLLVLKPALEIERQQLVAQLVMLLRAVYVKLVTLV